LLGGLGLLQFPEVPWAPSFNSCEIEHDDLIHDQFPTEAIVPFESTGLAVIAGRSLQQENSVLTQTVGSTKQFEIRRPFRRCETSFGAGLSVG
jgi:hypothetical protein